MSLKNNIDHLELASGIRAVTVTTPEVPRISRGEERWIPVLDSALNLFAMTNEPSIRLVVGGHTIVVQRENLETVAVVLPTGHAIAKSLRRMIRRMAKKDRGPVTQAQRNAPQLSSMPQRGPGSFSAPTPSPQAPQGPQGPRTNRTPDRGGNPHGTGTGTGTGGYRPF